MYWHVTFDGEYPGPSDDYTLEFKSMEAIGSKDKASVIVRKFVDQLIEMVKFHENYHIVGNIKSVISPSNEDHSDKAMFAIVGFYQPGRDEPEIRIGLLIAELIGGNFQLLGIWPDEAADASQGNIESLSILLDKFLNLPDVWTNVFLITPVIEE